MSNAIIYPVDQRIENIIRYSSYMEKINLKYCSSPFGWKRYVDKSIYNNNSVRYIECPEEHISDIDTFIISESVHEIDQKSIVNYLEIAKKYNKNIIVAKDLDGCDEVMKSLNLYSPEKICFLKEDTFNITYSLEFFDIDTPILYITNLFKELDISDLEIIFGKKLEESGYKVLKLSLEKELGMFGYHIIPNFLSNKNLSEKEKILSYNHYIKKMEIEEKPDIILIGIDDGMFSYSRRILEDFGIINNYIAQTISPDYVILSVPYFENEEFYYSLYLQINNRYNYDIGCFKIENKMIEVSESDAANKIRYLTVKNDKVDEIKCRFSDKDNFIITDKRGIYKTVEETIRVFREFGKIQYV